MPKARARRLKEWRADSSESARTSPSATRSNRATSETDCSRTSREQSVSDVALLERVAEGDVRALSELSARHSLSLRALAFGILRDAVQAEQVVQTTFREVRYEAGRFDPAHFPVFGWLSELTRVSALQRSRVRA